jgi:hypothetical protein
VAPGAFAIVDDPKLNAHDAKPGLEVMEGYKKQYSPIRSLDHPVSLFGNAVACQSPEDLEF